MKYNELGKSGIKVSELCLGSMTWGSQNSQTEANHQIEICLDHGINFLDTAEMYPTTPRSKQSQGKTEEIIGNWTFDEVWDIILGVPFSSSSALKDNTINSLRSPDLTNDEIQEGLNITRSLAGVFHGHL